MATTLQAAVAVLFLASCTAVHGCNEDQEGKIWALVAAGSDDWDDYRHQADALHAYQVLIKRGIPAENIVTLIADTLAHNEENPYPGKVFNTPAKVDVYTGAKIDYSGDAVTPANFLAVLSGNKSALEGGNGRVIESGPNDRIFVYFVDHGAVGHVVFPGTDVLTRHELLQTLREMHAAQKYKQLTFYMETCFSGSMFEGSDADKLNVYAMTAVNATVSSWGTYCDVVDGLPCLGDVFSVNWMADTEQHADETLQQQYETVRNKSWTEVQQEEHTDEPVCQWGDLGITKQPISDFIGKGTSARRDFEEHIEPTGSWAVVEIPVKTLEQRRERQLERDEHEAAMETELEIKELQAKRAYFDAFIERLAMRVTKLSEFSHFAVTYKSAPISDELCHHRIVKSFNEKCFTFSKNPYAMQYGHVFVNFCALKLDVDEMVEEIEKTCRDVPVSGIH